MRKKILIVDDEKLVRWSLSQKLNGWDYDVVEAENGQSALRLAGEDTPDLVMLDVKLPDQKGTDLLQVFKRNWPDMPVVMITAYGVIDDAVTAMRRGAYDFITKPIHDTKLQSTVKNAIETASLRNKIAFYKEKEKKQFDLSMIVTASRQMKQVLDTVKKIAQSEATIVLLTGESGTGKDLLAQAIHQLSRRRNAAYLAINCSAIPDNLLESELFGYEKGAFTDAKQQKKGLVELAHEGTLFLDEVSTLNIHLQAKLLRFLEAQTFKRVGGLKDIDVDLRVIAATNQDLAYAVEEGTFRQDLIYRLNVCPIFIPPLRERQEDIIPLAQHFIISHNVKFRKNIKGLNKESKKLFLEYSWPGNVRELRNAIERAMIFEEEDRITPRHLPIRESAMPHRTRFSAASRQPDLSLPEMEKRMLVEALEKAQGNQTKAAQLLNITRDTLRYRLKKFRIRPKDLPG